MKQQKCVCGLFVFVLITYLFFAQKDYKIIFKKTKRTK